MAKRRARGTCVSYVVFPKGYAGYFPQGVSRICLLLRMRVLNELPILGMINVCLEHVRLQGWDDWDGVQHLRRVALHAQINRADSKYEVWLQNNHYALCY